MDVKEKHSVYSDFFNIIYIKVFINIIFIIERLQILPLLLYYVI